MSDLKMHQPSMTIDEQKEGDCMTGVEVLLVADVEEFAAMPKEEHLRYELIDGAVMMSPSPSFEHQQISGNVLALSKSRLKGQCLSVFEYDLKVDNLTLLKPDVSVYCREDKQVPEIVFEVLSPSTRQRDIMVKPAKYKAAGVKEYWIIDPVSRTVIVHSFVPEGTDEIDIYNIDNTIQSKVRPEFQVAVREIFDEIA